MKPKFVDTNIFIRFLTADDKTKAKKCLELFQKVERRQVILTTTESVLSEVVYILSSKSLYHLLPEGIRDLLLPIVNLSGLKIPFKKLLVGALEIYAKEKIDFEDALSLAHMKERQIKEIYSYDKDFDKFSFVKRMEP